MKRCLMVFIFIFPSVLFAHEVRYSITRGVAYILDFYYPDGTKFAFESYEIYKPSNEKSAYQVGRTDEHGVISFVPDTVGRWKVRAFSDDGHGTSVEVDITEDSVVKGRKIDFFERFAKPIFGTGLILILFSIIHLFVRRRSYAKVGN